MIEKHSNLVDARRPRAEWFTGGCPIVDGNGSTIRGGVTAYKNFLLGHYSFPLYLSQNFISCPATFIRASALEARRVRASHGALVLYIDASEERILVEVGE